MPRSTCRVGGLLVLIACVALVATALTPRGMLRATAISQLDLAEVSVAGPGTVYTAPADVAVDLPGVRVLVAREELDADQIAISALLAAVVLLSVVGLAANPACSAIRREEPEYRCAALTCPCGDRAPPLSI